MGNQISGVGRAEMGEGLKDEFLPVEAVGDVARKMGLGIDDELTMRGEESPGL